MIDLRFHDDSGKPAAEIRATDFAVTGGVLWDHLRRKMIASYADEAWQHRGRSFSRVSVTGECCLLFGIARDRKHASKPMAQFSFVGSTLHANGVAFARYMNLRTCGKDWSARSLQCKESRALSRRLRPLI